MTRRMDAQEYADATNALIRWFNSQDIPPQYAIGVCTLVMSKILSKLSPQQQKELIALIMQAFAVLTEPK